MKWVEHSVGVVAPPGFAYQVHSLCSMGASCMAAIGVERHIYVWIGGWARGSDTVDKHYIDPTVLPTPAAYALWGWALTRQYTADAGVIEWHEPLPDPALEAPLEPTRIQPRGAARSAHREHDGAQMIAYRVPARPALVSFGITSGEAIDSVV